jgi:hypothetical protein
MGCAALRDVTRASSQMLEWQKGVYHNSCCLELEGFHGLLDGRDPGKNIPSIPSTGKIGATTNIQLLVVK